MLGDECRCPSCAAAHFERQRSGDCIVLSHAFIELCRRLQVEARPSTGVLFGAPRIGGDGRRFGVDRVGEPMPWPGPEYPFAFGMDRATGVDVDLTEPAAFLDLLATLGIPWVCTTAGSPYYNPHIQRPAAFPPSDGYLPPEDPLVGVARQIAMTARLKHRHPELAIVGSGYTYLQEWLPHVGQRVLRDGGADFIGLGRMVLSYPDLPADVLAEHVRARISRQICAQYTSPNGYLPLIALSAKWEQAFAESIVGQGDDRHLAMQPSRLSEFITLVREKFEAAAREGEAPVLVTSGSIRPFVRGIVERFRAQTPVISQSEIHPRARLKTVGSI